VRHALPRNAESTRSAKNSLEADGNHAARHIPSLRPVPAQHSYNFMLNEHFGTEL